MKRRVVLWMFIESLYMLEADNKSKMKQALELHTDHLFRCDAMTFVYVTRLEYNRTDVLDEACMVTCM